MKALRKISVVLMALILMSIGGCTGAVWFVDFRTTPGVQEWRKNDWFSPNAYALSSSGLYLDGKILSSPLAFDGDFKMEINFWLDYSSTIPMFEIVFDDGRFPVVEYISFYFLDIGSPTTEGCQFSEAVPYNLFFIVTKQLGFVRGGDNTLRIEKAANKLKIFLNDKLLKEYAYVSYDYDYMFLTMNVNQNGPDDLFITSVRCEFKGNVYSFDQF